MVAAFIATLSTSIAQKKGTETVYQQEKKLDWFRNAKLGLFMHWGPSSVEGVEISWARQDHPHDHFGKGDKIPNEQYDALYKSFNPVKFDADAWMKFAKNVGFKYIVFTAKHHDGFSNWHTKLRPDYSISETPFKRDICAELAEAAHKHGIKLGWYYSTRDWTHPDYLEGDNKKYDDFQNGQIRELLTNYGEVDMMWFDHIAGQWKDYTLKELYEMMYDLQGDDFLVNNRGARFIGRKKGGVYTAPDDATQKLVDGDFDTPEQRIGKFQTDRAWESCITMNTCPSGGWSYRPDCGTLTYEEVVQKFVHTVTGDGNMLLNVGPKADGTFPAEQVKVLEQFGKWMKKNGETIYGTRGGPVKNGKWGGMTLKGNKVYVHVLSWPESGNLKIKGLNHKIVNSKGFNVKKVKVNQKGNEIEIELAEKNRDALDSIIELELEDNTLTSSKKL